jgi:enoyl-CoA hydratase/carnithine racemase
MTAAASDLLGAEALSPLAGSPLVLLAPRDPLPPGGVRVVVDRAGALPALDPADYDVLVTTAPEAPAPWVSVATDRLEAQLDAVRGNAALSPVAAAMLARLLRMGEALPFDTALELESLAYSALLGGGEFARWLAARGAAADGQQAAMPVRYERACDLVTLTLASPGNRNAMTAAMRDALYEALVNVLEDPSAPQVVLRAEGKCFSTGGALGEFGSARDLAAAHVIRMQRSCARVLHLLGDRAEVHLHGACIGSGAEVPMAAARRLAAADALFQLPELRMGLIPGAGGTVTFARAIGRHRLLWLVLGGFRLNAAQALRWGLVHGALP